MSTEKNQDSVLHKIAATVRERVARDQSKQSLADLSLAVQSFQGRLRNFREIFSRPQLNVIAEVKLASPSRGTIAQLDPVLVAADYLANGAAALSILTEPLFFKGDIAYLKAIRAAHPDALLLQKDFVVDPYQIFQAKLAGADAILIIVALLGREGSQKMLNTARQLGLAALVEVHNTDELQIAIEIGAELIGINNRNLKDLTISLDVSLQLLPLVPKNVLAICESGIETQADLVRLQKAGCHGFLVGTSLMKTATPGLALARLLGHAH
ncbi:MAG: indole-3-glycerol phosphate synthase TrpC [Proteobacteria bacterium]|nr:indole-3-glycerol phosphate synthase TrpC [Pseudomonadota bacterium]